MRKDVKVIEINGFRGIILALAIVACLIAGFIVFPGFLAMSVWNYVAIKIPAIPPLCLLQGVLLWGIAVISYMIINNKHFMVSFKAPTELSDEEIKEVMNKIKMETPDMMSEIIAASKKSVLKDIKPKDNDVEDIENKKVDN